MKKLTFQFRNATFWVEIDGRKMTYVDKFGKRDLVSQMTASELAEYDKAQSEDDLAVICKRDCRLRGCTLTKEDNT